MPKLCIAMLHLSGSQRLGMDSVESAHFHNKSLRRLSSDKYTSRLGSTGPPRVCRMSAKNSELSDDKQSEEREHRTKKGDRGACG
jgi:hypothetical protein